MNQILMEKQSQQQKQMSLFNFDNQVITASTIKKHISINHQPTSRDSFHEKTYGCFDSTTTSMCEKSKVKFETSFFSDYPLCCYPLNLYCSDAKFSLHCNNSIKIIARCSILPLMRIFDENDPLIFHRSHVKGLLRLIFNKLQQNDDQFIENIISKTFDKLDDNPFIRFVYGVLLFAIYDYIDCLRV